MSRKWILVLLVCIALICSGCSIRNPRTAGQLPEGAVLFLPEGDETIPYVAVSEDYGGAVLLLRQEILPEDLPFASDDSAYYAESSVDAYLSGEFLRQFPQQLREQICDTEIEICCRFPDNSRTECISRRAFLLSATEVGIDLAMVTPEGTPLAWFRSRAHHPALQEGNPADWWLRSAYTADRGLAWHIQANGTLGGSGVWIPSGIRPAICLPRFFPVQKAENGFVPRA